MVAPQFFRRLSWRRTQQQVAVIIADLAPIEPPTQDEVLDQLDIDVVRQFQRMIDADADVQ